MEPELITIIEGPTPDFMPNPQGWVQSIYEGPMITDVALCQLRTGNGSDIVERCERAWREGRLVRLDYPDDLRLRQQVDVIDHQDAGSWCEGRPSPKLSARSLALALRVGRGYTKLARNLERENDSAGGGTCHHIDAALAKRVRKAFTCALGRDRLPQEVKLLHVAVAVAA